MNKRLRALIIEDNDNDAELIRMHLEEHGFELINSEHIETAEELQNALKEKYWDVILSDFNLPNFSAPEALRILKESGLDIPFIIVSGAVGEERAVTMMKAGAHDFILKNDLSRLYPVIEREIKEAHNRKARIKAEHYLRCLAEGSKALSESLDFQKTLNKLAQLLVSDICDWCLVDFQEDDGKIINIATAHRESELQSLVQKIRQQYPAKMDAAYSVTKIIHTGRSELIHEVTDDMLLAMAHNSDHYELLRKLNPKSSILVPLTARGRTFGGIVLVSSNAERRYQADDLHFAEDLAQRASMSIDNAQLFQNSLHEIDARDEFLSIASHELKTPVTSLKLQLQLTRRSIDAEQSLKPTPQKLARSLDLALEQILRLTSLIETLLDVSRIQIGQLDLKIEEVNLSDLVRSFVSRIKEDFTSAGCVLKLKLQDDVVGKWDASRIEQILSNLISNSIKYARNSTICITVEGSEDTAILKVEDNGPGIPSELLEKIFNRFERAMQSKNISGMGLGLFITKQLVEAHCGSINVQSEIGNGTTFTISLPLFV